ncbi:response regulator transcription factor [Pseudomonas aeruginosa]|uniref:response regulator transcription factor n=1 Tax=Pseudomonas aeruginosa TaxID=287 RepID=UPI001F897DF4|nr:response regulator transcription factor [Pseudomonas aeruginosa]MBF3059829.1 response regulator transcription factor [Pseudomonas aeruginosa]MBF3129112.1 response regulator transcription factor [Pseudomonas aeruginosa]MBF3172178.1 response regulator transcription factor [Pseudomonas aeruginosa]MBF3224131.1 response regulator transcription factor [Pseudomonas aeruginosa]
MHVLVVEDNFDLAGTVIDYLEAAGVVCDHARDGQAGLNLARANRYDVILLDIMLPRINGRQVCRQLREAGLQTPVLMLTALDTLQDKLDGFDAGADDYLLKPFDLRELGARLHTLQRRSAGRCVNVIEHGRLSYDPSTRETWLDGRPVELSRREQALLQALLNNRGRILSGEQLKDSVYGFGDEVESNALNVHIHHLRRKLGNAIVQTVRGLGYRLGPARGDGDDA